MWLLHAQDYKLVEFKSAFGRPGYSILSHKWLPDEDEVTFQDVTARGRNQSKCGWAKIERFCQLSVEHGIEYVWAGQ